MIDILMATYNGERYLGQQIDSILAQSHQDWQLLIRDDGSDDNTKNIIEDYAARYPDKIRLITDNEGHLGLCLNFAKLLEYADNEYIMFSDQDDVWLPNKIELTLETMKEAEKTHPDKPLLVHTDLKVVDSDLKTIADSMWSYHRIFPDISNNLKDLMIRNVVTGCTAMINKKAKEISMPIPEEARVHDWWIAMNVAKQGKIVSVSTPTVLYRQHSANIIGTRRKSFAESVSRLSLLKSRIANQYRMIKKVEPGVGFWWLLLNIIRVRILRLFR